MKVTEVPMLTKSLFNIYSTAKYIFTYINILLAPDLLSNSYTYKEMTVSKQSLLNTHLYIHIDL